MNKKFLLVLPVLVLISCAPPVTHSTPSGRPEVCITHAKPSQISADLASQLLDRQYNISQQSDTIVRGDRVIDNAMGAVLFGSRYDSTPVARITYNLVNTAECVRVVADINIVTNPGSAFERPTPMNQSQDSMKVQAALDSLKQKYEVSITPETPIKTNHKSIKKKNE